MRQVDSGERAFIVGCGYAGERLVNAFRKRNLAVVATSRTGRTVADLTTMALDLDDCRDAELPAYDVLFYLAPPPAAGETDTRSEALIEAIERTQNPPRAVVLVSTTGVYGDCSGAYVDELSPLRPSSPRAQRRVASERVWRAACARWRRPLAVLRVAGIYGPGRLPFTRLVSGEPVLRPDLAPYSNRIHVDDLVSALQFSVGLDGTLDVADGTPLPVSLFYHCLADAAGMARLAETDDPARVPVLRGGPPESRKILARRLAVLLGGLRYPDLAAGLRASVREAGASQGV